MGLNDDIRELLDRTSSPKLKVVTARKVLVGGAADALDTFSESTTDGTAWPFTGMARNNGGSGYIVKAHAMLQTTNLTPRWVLLLFTKRPTCNLNDNVTNTALLFADIDIYVGKIDFPAMEDIGTGVSESMATPSTVGNLLLAYTCAGDSTSLYGVAASRDGLTPTAKDELRFNLTVERH